MKIRIRPRVVTYCVGVATAWVVGALVLVRIVWEVTR